MSVPPHNDHAGCIWIFVGVVAVYFLGTALMDGSGFFGMILFAIIVSAAASFWSSCCPPQMGAVREAPLAAAGACGILAIASIIVPVGVLLVLVIGVAAFAIWQSQK